MRPWVDSSSPVATTLALSGIWAVATLVNVTNAVHMDDPVYLEIARAILRDPLHVMSSTFRISGSVVPVFSTNQPHLLFYGYAGVIRVFGESEVALHLFHSLFAGIAIACFFGLAHRLCPRNALLLTAAFALGPAFLPSQNLMTDVPLTALWLAFFWLLVPPRGEALAAPRYAAAAAVAGAACLVKYTSVVLVPLLLVPVFFRRQWRCAWVVLIPVGVIVAWSVFNLFDYGEVHILTRRAHAGEHSTLVDRAEAWLKCLGGVAPFSIATLALFASRRRTMIVIAVIAVALTLLYWGSIRGEDGFTPFMKVGFLANGSWLMLATAACLERRGEERREEIALLAGWLAFGTIFGVLLAPFMAVRHVLLVLPAVLLFLGRWLEGRLATRWLGAGALLTAILGFGLAAGDWYYADVFRTQARALGERYGEQKVWFLGNWGWSWYAEKAGMEHYIRAESRLEPGDIVVIPKNVGGPNHVAEQDRRRVSKVEVLEPMPPSVLLPRVMLPQPVGGFYSLGSRGLPWTFSRAPLDEIMIFRVHANPARARAPRRP